MSRPDLPDSDVLVKNDPSQPLSDADWNDALQLDNFSEGVPSSGVPYRQPQFSASPLDWSRFKAGIDWNAANQATGSSQSPTAETAGCPISDVSHKPKESTAAPSSLLTQQTD